MSAKGNLKGYGKTIDSKKLYYYTVNGSNKTITFYSSPSNKEYSSNTGTVLFTTPISELKNISSTGSSNKITNANSSLISSFDAGFLKDASKTALSDIENAKNPDINKELGIQSKNDVPSINNATDGQTTPEVEKTEIAAETDAPAAVTEPILNPFDAASELVDDRAKDTEITINDKLPSVGAALSYPVDLDTAIQDTLQIEIYQYQAARALPDIFNATDADRELGGPTTLRTESLTSDGKRRQKLYTVITLPIPNAVADSNSVGWGGGEFRSIAGSFGQGLAKGVFGISGEEGDASILEKFNEASNILGGTLDQTISGAGDVLGNKYFQRKRILEALAKSGSKLGLNVDVTQVITRMGGIVENPNLELLFTGPSLRTFQFQVRFTPRSIPESQRVRTIIRAFKQHSAVKKGVKLGTSGFDAGNLLLGTPDVFVLKYIQAGSGKEIKGLNKMKTCALTNVSVDYTGGVGKWAAYDGDSQPMTSIVTLAFAELAPIYDEDYVGISVDEVGF